MKKILFIIFLLVSFLVVAQDTTYKKRVLEATEIDALFSYYNQDGEHAAVTGGEGTEELDDTTASLIVRLPINEDDVLTVDVGVSAYSSASSSNINPLDGDFSTTVSSYIASSGASQSDVLTYVNPTYQHSSDNRNKIWNVNAYFSKEYDYSSIGFGGGYSYLFNQKNTELSANIKVYLDKWNPQYPVELKNGFFDSRIEGEGTYSPIFVVFDNENRNTYSLSLGFSQILSKRLQGSISVDFVTQNGLLSTPFQRVYFANVDDFFIDDFQLADNVEQLPDSRFKLPIGGRLNYYLSDTFIIKSYYRYYTDDWGVSAHTASVEVPVKLGSLFTLYPNYRFYTQSASDYFYPKEVALSTSDYYTSDYDLSNFNAHQYGLGIRYKDIFTTAKLLTFGLKIIDFRFSKYDRNDGLDSYIFSFGTTFVR
ncbi:DUF3570 domain-containing protein [Cellulophaga baltica]|uniref:DUF3570 domain-containing protein n=1 Tax=Cellulophaga TaxID=104264 RepID=UPI001C0649DD|nr:MULTISPECIES: DUF3570 domain-containing protein [Cellulophaga]MBU2996907.1 DUF3570 domain-containing protein [Cellulophaga baltica]MDO6768305.1 DUF3570 domain-containing protein [Cellulophaga sp. 1_MG-2023]